ncbi:MAG: YCF48-related protein, partial [Chloroflexota bacterium]|nr:YCF48-related protein [Chloroflexota bacterium]
YDFADAQHGWLAAGPYLFATTDGGQHWATQYNAGGGAKVVSFVSPWQGWMGVGGALLTTSDGGTTWTLRQSDLPATLLSLRFLDAQHAWGTAMIDGLIAFLHTSDEGRHWARVASPCPQDVVLPSGSISFITPTTGWALCTGQPNTLYQSKSLFQTTDSGQNWQLVTQADSQHTGADDLPTAGVASGISFADATHGWLGAARGGLLATHDGGVHWTDVLLPVRDVATLLAPRFLSPQQGWGLFSYNRAPVLLATSNGGASWQQIYPAIGPTGPVQFFDAHNGIGIGTAISTTAVLHSADSGRSWSPVGTLPSSPAEALPGGCLAIDRLLFTGSQHGWVTVGTCDSPPADTRIYRTNDGGRRWALVTGCPGCVVMAAPTAHLVYATQFRSSTVLLVSHDDGATFAPVVTNRLDSLLFDCQFVSPTVGWCQTPTDLVQTTDGGHIWTAIPLAEHVRAFSLLPDGHAWVLGGAWDDNQCSLLASADGGRTWKLYTGLPDCMIRDSRPLTFTDAQHGWLATVNGHLWATLDGGLTWDQLR